MRSLTHDVSDISCAVDVESTRVAVSGRELDDAAIRAAIYAAVTA
ncbi:MAG TPA: hypothetical protein VF082_10025 [Jiangellaceae bacterium]